MHCPHACGSTEHRIARRTFLGGVAAGMGAVAGGLGALALPAVAEDLKRRQRQVLVVDLRGGVSQFESWDPKPGTDTGGPFRAIPTSVPGVHICELLPHTARQMHHLAIVRSINTREDDHGKGKYAILTGRRREDPQDYPYLGAVMSRALAGATSGLPGHVRIAPQGKAGRRSDAAYLGPAHASMALEDGRPPENLARPEALAAEADARRHELRRSADQRFAARRGTAETQLYTHNYEQALDLIARRDLFDIEREPERDRDRYGRHDFGRHCLLARRLLEQGVTFVQVEHVEYDTHAENFNFHIEQLGEFDRPFATLVADLADRGLLEHTLIVVLSEFGRTPRININLGRDHWGSSWSIALGGCGIQKGAVIGKTNDNGTAVADREVHHGHLFHTYLQAIGLDSTGHFHLGGREVPMADPAFGPIRELLA
jgi:hypothetical protein